ncbi:MAG: GNAT family N-acetyltransferase [Geminicoccaceae bacterium]
MTATIELARLALDWGFLALADPAWQSLLGLMRHDLYHLPDYVAVEAARTDAEAMGFLGAVGRTCLLRAALPRHCPALGGSGVGYMDAVSPYGYPGPIASLAARADPAFLEESLAALFAGLREHRACSLFLRSHPLLDPLPAHLVMPGITQSTSPTVAVDLTLPVEKLWSGTRRGHQSTINKCQRLGQEATVVAFDEGLPHLLPIYAATLARTAADLQYHFDAAYFAGLGRLASNLHIALVRVDTGEVAAACLLFECDGIVQAHLGGSDSRFIRQSPFSLLLHHVRLWAKARGNRVLHLGGGVGGGDDAVMRFKTGFSSLTQPYRTIRAVLDAEACAALTRARAAELGTTAAELEHQGYFPAYRTTGLLPDCH